MRLIALVKAPENASCRYRIEGLRPHLEEAGHRLEVESIPRRLPARLLRFRALRRADAVILQRRLLPRWTLRILRGSAARLIFDFDDAVFRRDSYSRRPVDNSILRLRRFIATCRAADAIVAGNSFLAEEAARFADRGRIHVVPTSVEPALYPLAEHSRNGGEVHLAWIGSTSTVQGLERAAPLLDAVARAIPGIQLKVICDAFPAFRDLRVIPCRWSAESEAGALAEADIGISWIPEDGWSLGKCGLKVLQYMAAGLPVVANPVGIQVALVRNGETGYLAATEEQWIDAVRSLAADPELRRRFGRAGRKLVESGWTAAAAGAAWRRILSNLA